MYIHIFLYIHIYTCVYIATYHVFAACGVLQCVLQCVAVCCSVLQCVAVYSSVCYIPCLSYIHITSLSAYKSSRSLPRIKFVHTPTKFLSCIRNLPRHTHDHMSMAREIIFIYTHIYVCIHSYIQHLTYIHIKSLSA